MEGPSTPGDVTTHREQDLSPSSCLGAEHKEGNTVGGIRDPHEGVLPLAVPDAQLHASRRNIQVGGGVGGGKSLSRSLCGSGSRARGGSPLLANCCVFLVGNVLES